MGVRQTKRIIVVEGWPVMGKEQKRVGAGKNGTGWDGQMWASRDLTVQLMELVHACAIDARHRIVRDESEPARLAGVRIAHDDAVDHLPVDACRG